MLGPFAETYLYTAFLKSPRNRWDAPAHWRKDEKRR